MGPLDFFWHLLNLLMPALGMALVAPTLAKLLWRRELAGVPWRDLALWVGGLDFLVVLAGLVLQGRDGRMATYAALVLVTAVTLGWRGWRGPAARGRRSA